MNFDKFEQIGVSTDWTAVIIALIISLLVKFGIIGSIPW